MTSTDVKIPKIIIIVPYRDREVHRSAFVKIMPEILEDLNYNIFFIHQNDKRPFNRGAIKNIGFLYVKKKYPLDYDNITLIFHDIDNMPWKKSQFSYETKLGEVNHFYGFTHTLGGILAIKGRDFELINGFPNIWTWGLEDNILKKRCDKNNIIIKRDEFIDLKKNSHDMINLWHGVDRFISNNIENKFTYDNGYDGIRTIKNINMEENNFEHDSIFEINVKTFEIPESLDSIYVRNASVRSSLLNARMNKKINNRQHKLGVNGKFGKKMKNKNFILM
jgi:hypothetical protein